MFPSSRGFLLLDQQAQGNSFWVTLEQNSYSGDFWNCLCPNIQRLEWSLLEYSASTRLNRGERWSPKWEPSRTEIGQGKGMVLPGFTPTGSWKWQWYCGSALAAAVMNMPGLNITVLFYAQIILKAVSAFQGLLCLKASVVSFCLYMKPKLIETPSSLPPSIFPSSYHLVL